MELVQSNACLPGRHRTSFLEDCIYPLPSSRFNHRFYVARSTPSTTTAELLMLRPTKETVILSVSRMFDLETYPCATFTLPHTASSYDFTLDSGDVYNLGTDAGAFPE